MSITISIDPGVKSLGVCVFEDGVLKEAAVSLVPRAVKGMTAIVDVHKENLGDLCPEADEVALELMRYRERDARSIVNDLIDVATIGAMVAAWFDCPVYLYPPSAWKSNVPKAIHQGRVLDVLEDHEKGNLLRSLRDVPKRFRKEALDALGIGCYHLRRTNKAGKAWQTLNQ